MIAWLISLPKSTRTRLIAGLGAAALAIYLGLVAWSPAARPESLRLYFLDVGQGDAILLADDSARLLIDGGPDRVVLSGLGAVLPYGDRQLDAIAATHPHDDHTAGLAGVLERFQVGQLLLPAVLADHPEFDLIKQAAADAAVPVVQLTRGDRLWLSGQTALTTLWPPADCFEVIMGVATPGGHHDPVNSCSLVFRLDHCDEHGCRRALLLGDATTETEHQLLALKEPLAADLLKVGHHGSRYSSLPEFVSAVQPDQAVIQVGDQNRFGHPDYGVLLRLQAAGAAIFRNDWHGLVTALPAAAGFRVTSARNHPNTN
jgi:competence protein ComEC